MDATWSNNDSGEPLDENTSRRWRERKEYVEKVAKFEVSEQMDDKLSTTLNNSDFQNLAYAMRVYLDPGKLGFYHKVLEPFDTENV